MYRRKYNIPHEWGTAVNGPHAENIRCQVAASFLAAERLDGKSAYVGCRSLACRSKEIEAPLEKIHCPNLFQLGKGRQC